MRLNKLSTYCGFLVMAITIQAYAGTIPSAIKWISTKSDGIYSSHVEACAGTLNPAVYSNFVAGECLGDTCDCYYESAVNPGQLVHAQNWVMRENMCPEGMALTGSGYPAQCIGDPVVKDKCPSVGNPVWVLSGNKHQVEKDALQIKGLEVIRYFNSQSPYNLGLGSGWSSVLVGKRLVVGDTDVLVFSEDGRAQKWSKVDGVWSGPPNANISLTDDALGYKVLQKDLSEAKYDFNGSLVSVSYVNGIVLNFQYSLATGYLEFVSNNYGEQIALERDSNGVIVSARNDHAKIMYEYFSGRLVEARFFLVDSQGAEQFVSSRQYLYKSHPRRAYLSGIIDEAGAEFASWDYDAMGRAIISEHAADKEKVVIDYSGASGSEPKVSVTNVHGKKADYFYSFINGGNRLLRIEGQPSPNCAAANKAYDYYANGTLKSKTDWEGNTTTYIRDALGREASRTEASGTPHARTITTEYHPILNKPIRIVEPGLTTEYQYDPNNGRLLNTKKISTVTP